MTPHRKSDAYSYRHFFQDPHRIVLHPHLILILVTLRREVRRAALYNLPRTPQTLPFILARTRDIDPLLRRTVYQGSLSGTALPDPRVMSIAQREGVVQNGLGDREATVRKAAGAMLSDWLDHAEGNVVEVSSTHLLLGVVRRES